MNRQAIGRDGLTQADYDNSKKFYTNVYDNLKNVTTTDNDNSKKYSCFTWTRTYIFKVFSTKPHRDEKQSTGMGG